ncbi:MAG: SCO family protein [Pirellulales bacterium]|nr:SCO family protein [Pirellulales bacterium]
MLLPLNVGKVIRSFFYRLITLIAILVFAGIAEAQLLQDEFGKLDGVGVDEKLEAVLPLDLTFKNSSGQEVTLGEILSSEKPLLLSLNYSDCPMLCRLQLNGLVDGMRQMRLEVGTDFDVVSVSVDPLETPMRARLTKQNYVRSYGRPQTASGWHFLCGDKSSIDKLADSVGFRFKYVPERDEYAHAAVTIVITPGGVVSRYLYGVVYEPQTLRLALVEAAEGKIGTTLDRVLLFCFHYDASSGRYAPVARNLLKVGGVATLIVMAAGLIPVWLKRRQVPVTSEVVA